MSYDKTVNLEPYISSRKPYYTYSDGSSYVGFENQPVKRVCEYIMKDVDKLNGYKTGNKKGGTEIAPGVVMYQDEEWYIYMEHSETLYNVPLLYYVLDIWPVSAASMLKSKWNPVYPLVGKWSRKIYQNADRILVTSRPFIEYLHDENRVPVDKLGYLPQHAGDGMIDMDLKAKDNGITDFMFAGNLGNGQRLDVIVNAAAELGARCDYKVHIVGDGSMRAKLEQMVAEKGLEKNFVFYGNQKREDMSEFYRKADALLITLRGNNEVGNTMPGKLQMYMTTGKPILGAINGAAQEVIHEANCGNV
jgi:glycosyltransferase involved in cell wall biosynthesis